MIKHNNIPKKAPKQTLNKQKDIKGDKKQSKLQKQVKQNPNFQFIQNGKIKCILTGHEFAPTLQNYQKYLQSKSYKRGIQSQFNIEQYAQILVQHKLTGAKLPKKKTAIEKHINSRRFKQRLQQVQQQDAEQEGEQEELEDIDVGQSQSNK